MPPVIRRVFAPILSLLALLILHPWAGAAEPAKVGVVVMHGKGGSPGRFVNELATTLKDAGFQVANLEMPWSGRRDYDVNMAGADDEITRALDAMRAKGARKVFVAGHSQGGLFAVRYAGANKVDGVIPIAPGGQVNARTFVKALGEHVNKAKAMIAEGKGDEKAAFGDYEGSRGPNTIHTTAAIYQDWFDPETGLTSHAYRRVQADTPVLYVAPTRDYPGLKRIKRTLFEGLPPHPLTRMVEPDSKHLDAPTAAAEDIVAWIKQVAAQ